MDEQGASRAGAGQTEGLPEKRPKPPASRDKLTQKTIKIGKKQVRLATLGVLVAVAGIVVAVVIAVLNPGDGGDTNVTGDTCVGRDNIVCHIENRLPSEQDPNDNKFKEDIQRDSRGSPSPNGPWPYVVYNTIDSRGIDIGLKVRAGPEIGDPQVGSVARREVVWAECITTSTFDPAPDTGVGPTWVKISWPNNNPTAEYFKSSPEDRFRAYVYAGNVLPFTHNGNIPHC